MDTTNTKLVPKAVHLYNIVKEELELMQQTDEQNYHILRYLTNMLECKEEVMYKQIVKPKGKHL